MFNFKNYQISTASGWSLFGVSLALTLVFIWFFQSWLESNLTSELSKILVLTVYSAFIFISVFLIWTDLKVHKLPNFFTLSGYVLVFGLAIVALIEQDYSRLFQVLLSSLGLFLIYLILTVLSNGGFGGGDIKLAGVLGGLAGFFSWQSTLLLLILPILIGGVWSLVTVLSRVGQLKTSKANGDSKRIPYGPALIIGFWLAIFFEVV